MILRQLCVRHGRGAALQPLRPSLRYNSSNTDTPQSSRSTVRIIGHPEDESSILDAIPRATTAATQEIEQELESIAVASKALDASINTHRSSIKQSKVPTIAESSPIPVKPRDPPPFAKLSHLYNARKIAKRQDRIGTVVRNVYNPKSLFQEPPTADQITLPMLLANQTHLGHATSLWHPSNSAYIFGIREGIHIISLDTTFAYLRRAAKVVQEVARRGGIIVFLGTRKGWVEIIVNSAKMAGGYHIFDRWTPGSLTNGQQILAKNAVRIVDAQDRPLEKFEAMLGGDKQVLRPDLVICLNPIENEVCLHECGLYNVPTIGVVDTDCNPSWVTYPIPANDDSLRSIGLISGVLARAGQEGQRRRLEEGKRGVQSYDARAVQNYINMMEEVQALDVNDASSSSA